MNWFYAESGQTIGPVSEEELLRRVAVGTVRPETLVWHEGMSAWEPWAKLQPAATPTGASSQEIPSPPPVAHDAPPAGTMCAECGRIFAAADTVQFEGRSICAACKPLLMQRLREGAPIPIAGNDRISEEELLARGHVVEIGRHFNRGIQLVLQPADIGLWGGVLGAFLITASGAFPYLGAILRFIFTGPILGGLIRMYLEKERGGRPDMNTVFSGFGPRFGSLVGAWAIPMLVFTASLVFPLFGAMIFAFGAPTRGGTMGPATFGIAVIFLVWAIGAILLLYFLNRWQYATALVIDKGYSATAAMRLSWKVVGQNAWAHGFFLAARLLVILAGFVALCVGALVTYPIATATLASQYDAIFRNLRRYDEP